LTEQANLVTVHIKYKNVEETFSGSPEQVWLHLNKFFAEMLPSFETANRLNLNIDLQTLVRDSEKIIAFSEEGPYIMAPRNRLTDNETLSLVLLANHLGFRLGKIGCEGLSKEELQSRLGKDTKITSTRVGELVKNQIALKTADEKYKITTFGLAQMQKDILPKIKAKIGM
jgi:hypothetical protein